MKSHGLMKVAFVVKINFNAIISTAYLVNVLKFFTEHYDVIILTNAESYLKKQGVNAKYEHIPTFTFPNISRLFINDNITNQKLKKIDYDLLVIWYDSLIFSNQKKPVLRFVDVCLYQTFERSMRKNKNNLKWNPLFKSYIDSFKKSTFIITVSPQMRQLLVDHGIPKEKIAWLTFGVDLEKFSDKYQQKESDEFVLISPVQFLPHRGSNLIIKVMKKLSKLEPKIRFLSIGNGNKHLQEWNSTLKKMKLNNHIILQGIIDNKKIPEYLSKSQIGISLLEKNEYYNKSPPQKIFEYMAMGLPTIANNLPTHTDYIKDGYNGFIIETSDEFVDAVIKLKNDKQLYKKISQNAKKSAIKYDLKKIELKLKEYVDNIIDKTVNT